MDFTMDEKLGKYRLRGLTTTEAALLVTATADETAPALWSPHPAGPYTTAEAQTALRRWTPQQQQVSYGALGEQGLVAAFGVMLDSPESAELCYWVPPTYRGRGLASQGLSAVTAWAHRAGLGRLWLEIDPANAASQRVAGHAGFKFEKTLPAHCRDWAEQDPARDSRHDCQIYLHTPLPIRQNGLEA